MDCAADADRLFGPVVAQCRREFDFTLFFEQAVLSVLPNAAFIILAVVRLAVLFRRGPSSLSPRGWLSLAKLSVAVLSAGLAVALLAQNATASASSSASSGQSLPSNTTTASVPAAAVTLVASLLVCLLSLLEHAGSLRPSSLLLAYLFADVLCLLPQIRTYWLMPGATALAATLTVDCAVKLVLFTLESRGKRRSLLDHLSAGLDDIAAEELAGPISRTFFQWLFALLVKGYNSSFVSGDIAPIDAVLCSPSLSTRFAAITTSRQEPYSKNGLAMATLWSVGWPLFAPVVPRLAVTFFTFSQSFVVTAMLDYLDANADTPANHGYGLIGACVFVYVGIAVSNSWYWSRTYRFVTMVRGGLTISIFEKMLRLRQDSSIGSEAMTLMVSDVQRIVSGLAALHEMWAGIIETVVATYLLWRIIGISCLTMLGLAIVCSFGSTIVAKSLSTNQQDWLAKTQDRIKATSRLLESLRVVKMLGSEHRIRQAISTLRVIEIRAARPFRTLVTVTVFLSHCTLTLSPFLVFATYIGVSGSSHSQLDTSTMFSSLVLISLLGVPLIHIFQSLPTLGSAHGCFKRIQAYLDKEEANRLAIPPASSDAIYPREKQPREFPSSVSQGDILVVRDASFSWSVNSIPVLSHVNLEVAKGAHIAIIGRVGSGKSLFINALVSEADTQTGTVHLNTKSVAYCGQVPWLENTSAELAWSAHGQNDDKWAAQVQDSCALDDIMALDDYFTGTIGSGGARLSGGQRQRLALARAVSSKRELVLLDDVFSALDRGTRNKISSRLLASDGLFRKMGTTVIYTTHDMQIASLADKIYEIDSDGRLVLASKLPDIPTAEQEIEESSNSGSSTPSKADNAATAGVVSMPNESAADEQNRRSNQINGPSKAAILRDRDVYFRYFQSIGLGNTIIFLGGGVIFAFTFKFPDLWTQWWSTAITKGETHNTGYWLGIYGLLEFLPLVTLTLWALHLMLRVVPKSASSIHDALLSTTLRAPFSFLSRTDTGSLMNRFNQDLMFVDSQLPLDMINTSAELFTALFQIILIAIVSTVAISVLPPLFIVLYLLQKFYLRTSKQLRLMELSSKAELHTKFSETSAGLATIRANDWTPWMRAGFMDKFDRSQEPFYLLYMVQRWLQLALNLIVAALVIVIAGVSVSLRAKVVAGAVGVAFLNATTVGDTLTNFILSWTSMETSLGAIARVAAFERETPIEKGPANGSGQDSDAAVDVPAEWPQRGDVHLSNVWASYTADVEDPKWNIRGVTLDVESGTRVAVCGRTGSGKSTLLLALLGMIDVPAGTIVVDGVDLSTVYMPALRHRFQVVSQDFAVGTVTFRQELDPAQQFSDDAIISTLESCGVWGAVVAAGGLNSMLDDTSLSAGEAQTLSMARVILQNSSSKGGIVLLDEVTSSMDPETEERIESLIAEKLKGMTVVSVLHRVRAAARYDKIAVLENGSLIDYGPAADVVQRSDLFTSASE